MGSRFKDRELGAIEADKRGGAEAGAVVGVTLVVSVMAPGVDQLTPTVASPNTQCHQQAAERPARVCGPSAARKAGTGVAQQCPEGSGPSRLRRR